jgi:hypothetical protein
MNGFGFGGFKLHGSKAAALVAAIAERLLGALSAGAPEVAFAGFNFHGIGALLSDLRF